MITYDPLSEELLLDWFTTLDPPYGFRAELIEGELLLTPPPDGSHEHCLSLTTSQMYTRSATGMAFSGHKGLKLRGAEGSPDDHVIPDWLPPDLASSGEPPRGCPARGSPW